MYFTFYRTVMNILKNMQTTKLIFLNKINPVAAMLILTIIPAVNF